MPQYKFHFKKETVAAGSTSISVKTIVRSTRGIPDGVYHAFPKQLQGIDQHTELLQIGTIKSQLTSIANLRNIAVTLKEPVESLYVDGEGNFVFKNTPLDECDDPNIQERKQPQPTGVESPNGTVADLMKRIRELESLQRETNRMSIKRAKDHFAIGDFDGKTDGAEYLVKFESECQRYEVQTDEEKIKVLGDFCKGRAAVWWATNEKMTDKIWVNWSASFKSTFGQKGWPAVRAAHAYRYQPGRSIIEYALEKQRLFADINPKIDTKALIDAIVVGLPIAVQKELNRDGLTSIDRLHENLQRLDDPKQSYRSTKWSENREPDQPKSAEKPRETCKWCEKLGFPGRKHASADCRTKLKAMQGVNESKKVNLVHPDSDEEEFERLLKCLNVQEESKN